MSKKKAGKPARVDYWHDPAAPKPTSRKPSASVIVRNSAGDLLLLRRVDTGRWTIPTGGLKKNETLTACAVRECREETGLEVEITGLAGVFSDPRHVTAYADGEVRQPRQRLLHRPSDRRGTGHHRRSHRGRLGATGSAR